MFRSDLCDECHVLILPPDFSILLKTIHVETKEPLKENNTRDDEDSSTEWMDLEQMKVTFLYSSIVPKKGRGFGPGIPRFLKKLRGQYPYLHTWQKHIISYDFHLSRVCEEVLISKHLHDEKSEKRDEKSPCFSWEQHISSSASGCVMTENAENTHSFYSVLRLHINTHPDLWTHFTFKHTYTMTFTLFSSILADLVSVHYIFAIKHFYYKIKPL